MRELLPPKGIRKEPEMKKYISLLVAWLLVFCFVLSSCQAPKTQEEESLESGTKESETTPPKKENAEEPTKEPTEEITKEPTEEATKAPASTEPPHTHSFGAWKTVSAASCRAEGTRERSCGCGFKESEKLSVLAHNYVNGVCSMCQSSDPNAFVPDYASGQANTVGNESSHSGYASQADWIYFSPTTHGISKIKKDGSSQQTVYSVTTGNILYINVVGDWIYFYCEGNTAEKSYVAKVKTDGKGFEKVVSGVFVGDMLVVKDTLFFTVVNPTYENYAKDCHPLYSVSVNGGISKQIHDGAVISILADANYVYFLQHSEQGNAVLYRMKHDTTKKTALLEGVDFNVVSLSGSKLYFLVSDPYGEPESKMCSISVNGGSYTEYGKIPFFAESLYAIGNKLYYIGSGFRGEEWMEEVGLIEFDPTAKSYRVVKEEYEYTYLYFTGGLLILECYENEKLVALCVYDGKGSVRQITIQ